MAFDIKTDFKLEIYVPAVTDFTLGVSELGSTKVLSAAGSSWIDIGSTMASVNITNGPQVLSQIYTQPQPGALIARFQSATYDPNFNRKVRPGILIKCSVKDRFGNWVQLFYGTIATLDAVYNYDGSNIITMVANDPLYDLVNKTADGFTSIGGITTDNFISYAMTYLDTAPYFVSDTGVAHMTSVTGDYTVGELLNSAVTCEQGLLWYEPIISGFYFKNRNYVKTAITTTPQTYFSDVHSSSPTHSCYQDIQIGSQSNQLVNNVYSTSTDGTFSRHGFNTDSIQLYGNRVMRINLDLDKTATEFTGWNQAAVGRIVQQSVQALTYKPISRNGELNDAVKLFVGSCVNVVKTIGSDTINQNFMVVNISHTIEPTTWQTTLGLWKGL